MPLKWCVYHTQIALELFEVLVWNFQVHVEGKQMILCRYVVSLRQGSFALYL
jgi:hypothetical protein